MRDRRALLAALSGLPLLAASGCAGGAGTSEGEYSRQVRDDPNSDANGTGNVAAPGLHLSGDIVPVHDPSIIFVDGLYHVFSTSQVGEGPGLIHWRTSPDLQNWTLIGAVFDEIPAWARDQIKGTRGIWAPDIIEAHNEFRLYYSVSTFGSNTSAIGVVATPTLDRNDPAFGWVDRGAVISSTSRDDYNAIDANVLVDTSGAHWMSFGSFWSGLKLIELDPVTGKRRVDDPPVRAIASRPSPGAIEAPYITERNQWYYLFAAKDFCCRGDKSTYYTIVGRSRSPQGPFLDRENRDLMDDGGWLVLHADLDPVGRFVGPGHPAILKKDGDFHIVYHAYDRNDRGAPTLRIQRLGWSDDGWPVAL